MPNNDSIHDGGFLRADFELHIVSEQVETLGLQNDHILMEEDRPPTNQDDSGILFFRRLCRWMDLHDTEMLVPWGPEGHYANDLRSAVYYEAHDFTAEYFAHSEDEERPYLAHVYRGLPPRWMYESVRARNHHGDTFENAMLNKLDLLWKAAQAPAQAPPSPEPDPALRSEYDVAAAGPGPLTGPVVNSRDPRSLLTNSAFKLRIPHDPDAEFVITTAFLRDMGACTDRFHRVQAYLGQNSMTLTHDLIDSTHDGEDALWFVETLSEYASGYTLPRHAALDLRHTMQQVYVDCGGDLEDLRQRHGNLTPARIWYILPELDGTHASKRTSSVTLTENRKYYVHRMLDWYAFYQDDIDLPDEEEEDAESDGCDDASATALVASVTVYYSVECPCGFEDDDYEMELDSSALSRAVQRRYIEQNFECPDCGHYHTLFINL